MQRGTKLCASFDSDYGADVDSVDTDVRIPSAPLICFVCLYCSYGCVYN